MDLAALSKYMPALMVVIFALGRKWRAFFGFLLTWIISLALVTIMNQTSLPRYLEENRTTTFAIIHRPDNAALIVASHRFGGWLGLPLLPVLAYLIFQRRIVTRGICLVCLLISAIYIRGGDESVLLMVSVNILTGLAFICDSLPFRFFQKPWPELS